MKFCNIPNKVIAITGGIASGKTTYCKELEKEGKHVFYADKIIKRIHQKEPVTRAVRQYIKTQPVDCNCILEGSYPARINFKELRKKAFEHPRILSFLEELIGSYFEGEFLKEYIKRGLNIPECYGDIPHGFDGSLEWEDIYIEHPLVCKMNIQNQFDDIVMLEVDEETQLKRIIARDGCSEETAKQIIERQRGYYDNSTNGRRLFKIL